MPPKIKPLADRIWSKVVKTDTCWVFTGYRTKHGGYGQIGIPDGTKRGKLKRAHRAIWELTYGPIPPGMNVLHRCDNPACVRPDHLWLGTQAENIADCIKKGRCPTPEQRAKLTPEQALAIRNDPRKRATIAREYGVSHSHVTRIKQGVHWKHLTSPSH